MNMQVEMENLNHLLMLIHLLMLLLQEEMQMN